MNSNDLNWGIARSAERWLRISARITRMMTGTMSRISRATLSEEAVHLISLSNN